MRELPIATRAVYAEENRHLKLQYIILVEELNGLELYGVKIIESVSADSISVLGVTMNARKIGGLIEKLADCTVTPIGLMDVLADRL